MFVHFVVIVICTMISTVFFSLSDWTESWCPTKGV